MATANGGGPFMVAYIIAVFVWAIPLYLCSWPRCALVCTQGKGQLERLGISWAKNISGWEIGTHSSVLLWELIIQLPWDGHLGISC